jgi:GH15 family glucan-1,4-alpha-glucosidase
MTPIKDYFLIGDLHSTALVSKDGSIDWLCFPAFDSPSVFAAILDEEKGGTFKMKMEGWSAIARYLPFTAIVETAFESEKSAFRLHDFMLPRPTEETVPHYLVRSFYGMRGTSNIRLLFDPRPNYARQGAVVEHTGNMLSVRIDERMMWLHLPAGADIELSAHGTLILFDLAEGETKKIVLEYAEKSTQDIGLHDWEKETVEFWRNWIAEGKIEYDREHLIRSAITLKLMQFYPTGGIVAAPTTSLPEEIGGIRNWDYRYVWMRDATFTLYALYVLGFTREAERFFGFIERIAEDARKMSGHDDPDLAIMYTIWGQPLTGETTLDNLAGYRNSSPVRIGNGASHQFQLDIYGSIIDAYYFMNKRGLAVSEKGKAVIQMLVRGIKKNWMQPDSGIWEVRGGVQHFAYSKLMAWVGMDRALKLADALEIGSDQRRAWEALKREIEDWLWKNCFDEELQSFAQYPGTKAQDASNFMFVLLAFFDRHDPRAKAVIDATRKALGQRELYVYRYFSEDGLPGTEGAFLFCTFWQIAAMAAVGDIREADELLKRMEQLLPSSGLMAEEIDPATGEYLGNHPQAFSHIGYIMASYYIHRFSEKNS